LNPHANAEAVRVRPCLSSLRIDQLRLSARDRGYTWRWQKERALFLRAHPLCVMCSRALRVTPATVVDHIVPHKGDQALFWSHANWQSLCKLHHDSTKHRLEGSGVEVGCDEQGVPLAIGHPWNGA
jgi:5-methylcytosine-specific restriction endonuclease McrA